MDVILIPMIRILIMTITIYWWAIVVYVFLGWLGHFGVIHRDNKFIYGLYSFLYRIIEPALAPIRRILPSMGGVDLSPLVLILAIYFIQGMLFQLAIRFLQWYP